MDMNFEEQIRERAYQIWLAGGMSDGMAQEHWVSAEQEVLVEITATPAAEPVVAAPAKPKRGGKAASAPKTPRAKTATKATKAKH